MSKYHLTILLQLCLLSGASCYAETTPSNAEKPQQPGVAPTASGETVVTGQVRTDDFIMRFHRAVRDGNGTEKSVVSSPFGAARLGEMLYDGAVGKTKEALRQAFLTKQTRTTIKGTTSVETVNWSRPSEEGSEKPPYVAVDGLWVQKGVSLLPTYIERLKEKFAPHVAEADFNEQTAAECDKINTWVENATQGRIAKLFADIDPTARLVLADAIYFQGKWAVPFDSTNTKPGPFQCETAKAVEVPFMSNTLRIGYRENDLYQAVELPYEQNRCSMVVILPRENRALKEVETAISIGPNLAMTPDQVDLQLPKFQIESDINLKTVLTTLDAGIVFDSKKADFTGMNGSGGLYVGQAAQKVFVCVDETGTEAAAASGAAVGLKSAVGGASPPKTFHANRPFLFLIRDNTTTPSTLLFIGRYVNP